LCCRESAGLKKLPNLEAENLCDAFNGGKAEAFASACFNVLKVSHG